MKTNYKSYSHAKGMNFWHLEWCTKYRYRCMRKLENRNLVEAAVRKVAHENGIKIHILEVLPEHVHLMVTLPRGMLDEDALGRLKGRSAYLIFRNKPKASLPEGPLLEPGLLCDHRGIARL